MKTFKPYGADVFKGTLRREFSDSTKGQITVQVDEFEKMYQNLYASGYDGAANTVTLDGYRDPTERENTFIDANLVNEFDDWVGVSYSLSAGRLSIRTIVTTAMILIGLPQERIKRHLTLLIL